jgi:hypothetical protein
MTTSNSTINILYPGWNRTYSGLEQAVIKARDDADYYYFKLFVARLRQSPRHNKLTYVVKNGAFIFSPDGKTLLQILRRDSIEDDDVEIYKVLSAGRLLTANSLYPPAAEDAENIFKYVWDQLDDPEREIAADTLTAIAPVWVLEYTLPYSEDKDILRALRHPTSQESLDYIREYLDAI